MEEILFVVLIVYIFTWILIYAKFGFRLYTFVYIHLKKMIPKKYMRKIIASILVFYMPVFISGLPIISIAQTYLLYNQNLLILEQNIESSKNNEISSFDQVKITMNVDNLFGPLILRPNESRKGAYYYDLKYKLLITNLGTKTTSIINDYLYSDYTPKGNKTERKDFQVLDFFCKPELLDFSGKKFYLPINLEPGETKGFHLKVRRELSPGYYEKIKDKLIEKRAAIFTSSFILNLEEIEKKNENSFGINKYALELGNGNIKELEIPLGLNVSIIKDTKTNEIKEKYANFLTNYNSYSIEK
ncbi:MAG: hypothetical protein WBF48_13045 [Halarcobacter sp.]